MRRLCFCLLALMLIGLSRGAAAHAVLLDTVPPDGAALAQSPDEIRLRFNEPVAPLVVRLLDGDGAEIAGLSVAARNGTVILRLGRPLAAGTYIVSYRVTSQDSHPVAGSLLFAVGAAAARPAPTADAASDGWRIAAAASRFLWIALSLTAAGLAMFLLLCGSILPPDRARPLDRRMRTAAGLALPVALLAVGLQGGLLLDAPATALLLDAWHTGGTTTLARSLAVGGAGLALLTMSPAPPRRASPAVRAVGIALITASFGLTGHAAAAAPALVMGPTVAIHAGVAGFWWGGLIGLGVALRGTAPATAAPVVHRFSRAALWLVALLVILGGAIALVQVRSAPALIETRYGLVLCGKLLAATALLALAADNRLRLTPRLARGDAAAQRRLGRSIRLETILVLAVFALTALLGQSPPPRALATGTGPVIAEAASNAGAARIEIRPGQVGRNELFLELTDANGRPLAAREVATAAALPAAGIEPIRRVLHETTPGRYHLPELVLPVAGRWSVRVDALVSDFDKRSFTLEAPIR